MKAYLEKSGKEWLDDFVYSSVGPLNDLGIEVIPFDGSRLLNFFMNTSFGKDDILIGSVEATTKFFIENDITIPKYLGYPESLQSALYRDIKKCMLIAVDHPYPYFIKPADDVKLFNGSECVNETQYNYLLNDHPNDTMVYVSDIIKPLSEYRCFIHKGELKGIKHYAGDFTLFPNIGSIIQMIREYKTAPISYTLDVCLDEELNTILIEVNDFWAIGSYGFDGKIYVRMLIDRFQELKMNQYK